MDPESTQLFNDRLAQWVSRQGFWFQLRYSMAGGSKTMVTFHVLRLMARAAIFVVILAIIGLFVLVKRADSQAFKINLRSAIVAGLGCDSGIMRQFSRTQNKASITHLTLEGGERSFFSSLEATGIQFRMGLLDGVIGRWDAKSINVDRLSMSLKAGAESEDEAKVLEEALFHSYDQFLFQSIEVKNASFNWGYSARTKGSINQSNLLVLRENEGWRLRFSGGTFQQNWMRNLQIDELVLLCRKGQLVVESAKFHSGTGSVRFENVVMTGGLRPAFSGNIIFESLPIEQILQDSFTKLLEGTISGDVKIGGSTNSSDGVTMTGRVALNERDQIIVRGQLPILNTLAMLSPSGSYRKTVFKEGYFSVSTKSGVLRVDNIQLTAPGQMDLKGAFEVRPPTQVEIDEALKRGKITADMAAGLGAAVVENTVDIEKPKNDEIKLKDAAKMAAKENKNSTAFIDDDIEVGVPFQAESIIQEMQNKTANKLAELQLYSGSLQMILPMSAFPVNSPVMMGYAKNPNGETVTLPLSLSGNVFEITQTLAEDLLLRDSPRK